VTLRIRTSRWRCRNDLCQKKFFSTPFAAIAAAYGRQTSRANAVTLMVGRALGGRAAERLMSRLGIPVSDDTVLRRLKHAACHHEVAKPRVIGIDDWAQRKGQIYCTIVVDLERRCVVDLLPDRSAETVVRWLSAHPKFTRSAAIATVCMRRQCGKPLPMRCRSQTAFTWFRISGKQPSVSWPPGDHISEFG
jgi:transposase